MNFAPNDTKRQSSTKWFWFWQIAPPLSGIPILYKQYPLYFGGILYGPYYIALFISFASILGRTFVLLFSKRSDKVEEAMKLTRPILTILVFFILFSTSMISFQKAKEVLAEDAQNIARICKTENVCPEIPPGWYITKSGKVTRDLPMWTELAFRYSRHMHSFEIILWEGRDTTYNFSGGITGKLRHVFIDPMAEPQERVLKM